MIQCSLQWILLNAMEYNNTMIRLVLPESVDMEEVKINMILGNINKERIIKGTKKLSVTTKKKELYPGDRYSV